jgi:hypothetical protein
VAVRRYERQVPDAAVERARDVARTRFGIEQPVVVDQSHTEVSIHSGATIQVHGGGATVGGIRLAADRTRCKHAA